MVREIDAREELGAVAPLDDGRRDDLAMRADSVSAALPGAHTVEVVSFDSMTGNPAVVVSTGARPAEGDFVARALQHLQRLSPALGLAADQPPEFVADPEYQTTSTGAVAVHLRQLYKGIPIYDGTETVRFDSDGRVLETAGRAFTVPDERPVLVELSAADALVVAAQWLAAGSGEARRDPFGQPLEDPPLDLSDLAPARRTVAGDQPDRPTVFDAAPFEHAVTLSLIWFPLQGGLRLAWQTRLEIPGGGQYRVIVDALDGRVLLCRAVTRSVLGRADVVLRAGEPAQRVAFPLPATSYGAPVPTGLPTDWPDHWLTGPTTDGACARAINAATGQAARGTSSRGEVVFSSGLGTDDLVVNLFALCGGMHDALYLLGFRESDGNFQSDNLGRGGRHNDAVLARVHPGAVWGTANMSTPPDGTRPEMNMGLVTSTNRHTALDPDVVDHEYAHGLTNRLVGGGMNDAALDAVQSAGMGEGWSDYFACTFLGKTVVGDWVVDDPGGIRRQAYDEDFPDTYADLGTAAYTEVHDIGELWCATLMSLARRIGTWVCAQVVVDGLKLTSSNPSFLAARDAILLAADNLAVARGDGDDARRAFVHAVWETFARYGMGPGARTDGPDLAGIVADFTVPPFGATSTVGGTASPALTIPDDDHNGVRSSIQLPAAGTVTSLTVTVDIAHPYSGDLVVTLIAPDGRTVPLQERSGGGANDIRETWRSTTHDGLAELHGTTVGGSWTLAVADVARRDVGQLVSWAVEAQVGDDRPVVEREVVVGTTIPDDDRNGLASTIDVDLGGPAGAVSLALDITHTNIGDLHVTLRGPTGKRVVIHRRGKGSTRDNLIETFGSAAGEPLSPFVGLDPRGVWTLNVSDRNGDAVGKLNRWKLTVSR